MTDPISYDLNLDGACVAITGAGGYLGSAIARGVSERGGDLLLIDRSVAPMEQLASELRKEFKSKIDVVEANLEGISHEFADEIFSDAGVTSLVNNAAFVGTSDLQGWATSFDTQDVDTWRRAVDVNLTAPFAMSQSFTRALGNRKGSIVNIGSIYAALGPDWGLYEGTEMGNPAAYAASKGGLDQLTRWMASTLGPLVRVNTVSPGGIERGQPEVFVERYKKKTPLGRMASEEDIVGLILFLLSPLSGYVTGQSISVDGGYSIM